MPAVATAQAQAPPSGGGCTVVGKARLPLVESQGRFSVQLTLDGQQTLMMVDTGAQRGALTAQTADRLRLAVGAGPTQHFNGVGGRGPEQHPRLVGRAEFGPTVWPQYPMQIIGALQPETPEHPSPAGLLGADMMSSYDVELDFPARTMTLYAVSGCAGDFVPWKGRREVLTPLVGPPDMFVITAAVNGHPIRALIDTGSNSSSLSRSAARSAKVSDAMLKLDPVGSYTGARGVAVPSHRHRFDRLAIGGSNFSGVDMSVQDVDFGAFDLLVGMDYLGSRRMWLSYSTHQLFMQTAARPVAPPAP